MIGRAVRGLGSRQFARRLLTCIVQCSGWTCLTIGSMQAQTVVGRVISASDSTPIVGAIIQLQAEKGGWLSVALSARDGMFSTRALSPGPYNVRVVRIGYKPFAAGMLSVQGQETSTTILWKSVAVSLPTQLTRSKAVCDISSDSSSIVLRVWEEARNALLAAILAEERGALLISRVNFIRTYDALGKVVRKQRLVSERALSLHAYISLPADSLAKHGYVRDDTSGVLFYAPDANALVSESFAASHCFSVRDGDDTHQHHVGLSFTPNKIVAQRVDIRGTFWLDRKSSHLESLEFQYEGLPAVASRSGAGGAVFFGHLPDGAWLVTEWQMRMPRLAVRPSRSDGGTTRTVLTAEPRIVTAVEEFGGIVLNAWWDSLQLYAASLPTMNIVVATGSPFNMFGPADVAIEGTDIKALADSAGRVTFNAVPKGRYSIVARFPALRSLGDVRTTKEINTSLTRTVDTLFAPRPEQILRDACGANTVRNKEAAVFGTLRDSTGVPTTGVVSVTWPASVQIHAARSGDGQLSWVDQMRGALVGSDGRFLLCGVPRLNVRAEGPRGNAAKFIRLFESDLWHDVPLQLRSGIQQRTEANTGPPTISKAYVEVHVTDRDSAPVTKMRVQYQNAYGMKASAITDETGRALLLDQPVGVLSAQIGDGSVPGSRAELVLVAGRNYIQLVLTKP